MQYCRKCPDAVAEIRGGVEVPELTGCVEFYQENGCVLIVARISGLPESETGFSDSIFTKGKTAPGLSFPKREAIIIQPAMDIQNTQVICRRCWHAKATHTCRRKQIGFR